ncbi:MAG: MFS transporter [Gammaproteobacteria bacterium]|nr:MFS transporter [Gammaproteobacteria bacterium]
MTPVERRASIALAGIMSVRMLGLFMILPVFALYAEDLKGAAPMLIGIAIGVYGLTQAIFQIPFGMLSDRFGRKPVITVGLLIFALGSVIAAMASSIEGVILGRALQGCGAIAAAVMALAADLTREEHRTKAMAVIGMSIGASFLAALVAGPMLSKWIGVPGLFLLIGVLAVLGIAILHFAVPQPLHTRFHRDTEAVPAQFKRVLTNGQLLRLDFGILFLHAQLMAMFVVLPVAIRNEAGLAAEHHWYIYLPVLAIAAIAMVPFIIFAEKRHKLKQVFVAAILVLGLAQSGLSYLHHSVIGIALMLILFFTAVSFLEAGLPSLISRIAPPDSKGTAMGVYSTAQFFGAFLGGAGGGWLHQYYGMEAVFIFCAGLAGLWLILAVTMQPPRYLSSHLLNIGEVDKEQAGLLAARLTRVPGVAEAVVIIEDSVAYLKVDRKQLDMAMLEEFSAPEEICC